VLPALLYEEGTLIVFEGRLRLQQKASAAADALRGVDAEMLVFR